MSDRFIYQFRPFIGCGFIEIPREVYESQTLLMGYPAPSKRILKIVEENGEQVDQASNPDHE